MSITGELTEWQAYSPDLLWFAAARAIPDKVYIHRHGLDGVAVAVFCELKPVTRHDFRGLLIAHIGWTPDSKFLLFTTFASAGHSPWHVPAFLFCVADKTFRDVEPAIGTVVSSDFQFEPPDVAILQVRKDDMPEEEVKVSLSKAVHEMPVVR